MIIPVGEIKISVPEEMMDDKDLCKLIEDHIKNVIKTVNIQYPTNNITEYIYKKYQKRVKVNHIPNSGFEILEDKEEVCQ